MFCDACGATVEAGQQFCTRCGKAVVGPVVAAGGRVARHIHLLGILWIAYGVLVVGIAFLLWTLATTLTIRMGGQVPAVLPWFLKPLVSYLRWLAAAKGIGGIVAGVGLLQRRPWARLLGIVVGVVSLFSIPFGIAMGIYTLWVLVAPRAEEEYRQLSVASS